MDNRLLLLLVIPVGLLLGALVAWALIGGEPAEWEQYKVDTTGMMPGWTPGLTALDVQIDAYGSAKDVVAGEVVVYESAALDRFCLARVIGVPGNRIEVRGHGIKIDGTPLIHDFLDGDQGTRVYTEHLGGRKYSVVYGQAGGPVAQLDVEGEALYLLGDSRTSTRESCFGGLVPMRRIEGRVE